MALNDPTGTGSMEADTSTVSKSQFISSVDIQSLVLPGENPAWGLIGAYLCLEPDLSRLPIPLEVTHACLGSGLIKRLEPGRSVMIGFAVGEPRERRFRIETLCTSFFFDYQWNDDINEGSIRPLLLEALWDRHVWLLQLRRERERRDLEQRMEQERRQEEEDRRRQHIESLLERMQKGDGLLQEEVELLRKEGQVTLLARYFHRRYDQIKDDWEAIKACRFYREADEPEEALELGEAIRPTHQRARSARETTVGAALRDLHRQNEAVACGLRAIEIDSSSPHPFNLLGALYYELGDFERGDWYFHEAEVRGAYAATQRGVIEETMKKGSDDLRRRLASHLLSKDRGKFAWAHRYL